MEEINNTTDTSSTSNEVSEILSEVYQERASNSSQEQADQSQSESTSSLPTKVAPEIEFTWNGKQIKAPLDKATAWASQGYDYSQKMHAFNKSKAEFDQRYSEYQKIDQFVKDNPDFWSYVQDSYKQRIQDSKNTNQLPQELEPVLKPIYDQLKSTQEFISQAQAEKLSAQRKSEDEKLTQEIQSIHKDFSDLDFQTPDAEGKTLEYKILEHAQTHGIPSFRAAFRDFYHDELIKRFESRGKEAAAKEVQKRTKLGLLGSSPTPKKGISQAQNIKSQSYEDLAAEALEELHAMRGAS